MDNALLASVDYRQPFNIEQLAPLVDLTARVHRVRNRRVRRLGRKFTQTLFHLFHGALGLPAPCRMVLDTGESGPARSLTFDGRDTGFGILYLNDFAAGYETATAALIRHVMPTNGVFYDVGANWGFFSLLMAGDPKFEGAVHAFEPVPETFQALLSLVTQAQLRHIIGCHETALSDEDGSAGLIRDPMHSSLSRLGDNGATDTVSTARMESLGLQPPDIIKIDVEGHEAEVLVGAEEILRRDRPGVIFESLTHRDDPAKSLAPFKLLGDAGYQFFQPAWAAEWKGGPYYVTDENRIGSVLALRPVQGEDRFLWGRDANVLAWPTERYDTLRALFSI